MRLFVAGLAVKLYFHWPTFIKALRLAFSREHFTFRHSVFILLILPFFFLQLLIVHFGRMVDAIFFRGYRKQAINAPIYIIANPRSGTTYLHRLMAMDEQFSTIMLYHTIFPAVIFYKVFQGLARMDRFCGRIMARVVAFINKRAFKGWDDIHATRLEDAEEDETLFVYAGLSPQIALLFPWLGKLEYAKFPDRLPDAERKKLGAYYRDYLQRHLYATAPDKVLLQKNTLISGRLRMALEVMPDMRIVHIVRHPYEPIPSMISMISAPWKVFTPHLYGASDSSRQVAEMLCEFYDAFEEIKAQLPSERIITIQYEDLVRNPKATVEQVYAHFNLEISPAYADSLEAACAKSRSYESKHKYSLEMYGLSEDWVYNRLRVFFEKYGFTWKDS